MKIAELLSFIPNFLEFQESPLILDGKEVAYQNSVISTENVALGTGFSLDRSLARQIGLSEAIERQLVANLYSSSQSRCYLLDEYPSTCGFAVGVNAKGASDRAIAEAVERWLRSKWIDEHYALDEFKLRQESLSAVEQWFACKFQEVRCFAHHCEIEVNTRISVSSVIVVGLTEQGAFVGSKSMVNSKVPLLPALVEAWRHLEISKTELDSNEARVIKHYAINRASALGQIAQATRTSMPSPELRLLEEVNVPIKEFFAFRALCYDFIGWHGVNLDRFVY